MDRFNIMKRYIKVFSFAGGLFALLLALIIYFSYASTFQQILSYSIISGSVFGIIVSLIVSSLKLPQKTNAWNYFRNATILLIAGFIMGIISYNMLARFPLGYWYKLPDPPEPMQEFVGKSPHNIWGGDIFTRSQNQELFVFYCAAERPCGWEKVDEVPPETEDGYFPCFDETTKFPPEPRLQGKIQDSIQFEICGVDYSIYKSYAINEHGEVYTYNRWSSVYEAFSVLPLTIGAAMISSIPGNFFVKKVKEVDDKGNDGT